MRKFLLFYFAFLLSMFASQASPAFKQKKYFLQPDGTLLTLVKQGNQDFNYYSTIDGLPVCLNTKGDYCYARMSLKGKLESTDILAHNESLRSSEETNLLPGIRRAFEERLMMHVSSQRYSIGSQATASVHSLGTIHIPLVLVEFQDVKFTSSADNLGFVCDVEFFNKHFNGENYTEDGSGSVRDYFVAQSDGQFLPIFDIIGPVTLSNTMSYYGENTGGDGTDRRSNEFLRDAINAALATNYDFSKYTTSSNAIPFTAIVMAGYGEQAAGPAECLWARYFPSFNYTPGGIRFQASLYVNSIADYYGNGDIQPDGIGTFCHEFSHAMGLPDFYPTNGMAAFGMDYWDIMDYGQFWKLGHRPVGYSAYEREFMGWLKIDTLKTEKQFVELAPLNGSTGNRAYKILNENTGGKNEYYILENRQSCPWFAQIFGYGMMVTHVMYNASSWSGNRVNNVKNSPGISIIPADGVLTALSEVKDPVTYRGDLFPGVSRNTRLSDTTIPCDTAFVGQYMHRLLSNIKVDDSGVVSFYYMCEGQLSVPDDFIQTGKDETSISVSWKPVENAQQYQLKLLKEGVELQTVAVKTTEYKFDGLESGNYQLSLSAQSEDYMDSDTRILKVSTLQTSIQSLLAKGVVDEMTVYSVGGQYLGTIKGSLKNTSVLLLHGQSYIVRTGGKTYKVIFK